jgi:hypothetical protein
MKFGLPQQTKKDKVKVDLASITGTYQDKWFEMLFKREKKEIILPLNVLLSLAAKCFL